MKTHIIVASICIMAGMLLFEFMLYAEGQNEYPGALTALGVMIAAIMFTANYQRTKED